LPGGDGVNAGESAHRNQRHHDARVGEVFVEITEKKQLPGFWILPAGRNSSLAEPKDAARRRSSQKLQPGSQKLAVCDRLNPIQEPKWKSWIIE
jgi:hypothetical protein